MKKWLFRRQGESCGLGHGIFPQFGLGGCQGPWRVMNFSPKDGALTISGVQAVAFRQEMLQRPGLPRKCLASRTIVPLEGTARCPAVGALTRVLDRTQRFFAGHPRPEIRQMKPRSREDHGDGVPG